MPPLKKFFFRSKIIRNYYIIFPPDKKVNLWSGILRLSAREVTAYAVSDILRLSPQSDIAP